MSERISRLRSIAKTISDYRMPARASPDAEHVDRWVNQFPTEVQMAILEEMNHVLENTYISRETVISFLRNLITHKALTGTDPCAFWKDITFFDDQEAGASQRELLELLDELLKEECELGIDDCGQDTARVLYLDDGVFTGNRLRADLETWLETDIPDEIELYVVTIVQHTNGQYYAEKYVEKAAKATERTLKFYWWRACEVEDRKAYTDESDVLRPVEIPDDEDVLEYVQAMAYKPHLRNAGKVGPLGVFSSEEGRHLLEQEFLKAGVRIRARSPKLSKVQRPLGHSTLETLGFGTLFVTFRNCPNNAPLALWAGDPWYPLFPRTTNTQSGLQRLLDWFQG